MIMGIKTEKELYVVMNQKEVGHIILQTVLKILDLIMVPVLTGFVLQSLKNEMVLFIK